MYEFLNEPARTPQWKKLLETVGFFKQEAKVSPAELLLRSLDVQISPVMPQSNTYGVLTALPLQHDITGMRHPRNPQEIAADVLTIEQFVNTQVASIDPLDS